MNRTVEGVWKDGRIVPAGPLAPTKIVKGMTEEEQRDDPESIERWIADLRAAPPLVMTPEEEAAWRDWERISAEYNLEVARRQMNEKFE